MSDPGAYPDIHFPLPTVNIDKPKKFLLGVVDKFPRPCKMEEEHREVFILLKDKEGEKRNNVVMGALFGSIPCNVLRGELATKVPEKSAAGQQQMYQTVYSDQSATFYDSDEDSAVAPLLGNQALLLAGVKSREERYKLFITAGKLEWGSSLKLNDAVLVSLNHLQAADNDATLKTTAVIQYVGPIKGENGIKFGVEIVEPHFYGQGTTDGTFKDERYFTCNDGNGMFVSFDKLSKLPLGGRVPEQPPHAHPHNQPVAQEGGKKGGKKKEKSFRFKVKDRVVAFGKSGKAFHGTVRWVGMYELLNEKNQPCSVPAVGIETDERVVGSDMESCLPAKHQYFSVGKMRSSLFVREEELMRESDFVSVEQPQKAMERSTASSRPPPHYPQQPSPPPKHQAHREKPRPEEKDRPQEPLDVQDTRKLAEQLGADNSEKLMEEQKEALRKAAKKKEKEFQEVRKALDPDESLNLEGQKRRLREFEAEKKKERSSGENPGISHIYDEIPAKSSPGQPYQGAAAHPLSESQPPAPAQAQPQPQYPDQYYKSQPPAPTQAHPQYHDQHYQGQPVMWAPPPSQQPGNMQPPLEQVHSSPFPPTTADLDVNKSQVPPHGSTQARNNRAYAGCPGETLPVNLGVGSFVQLVGDPNRYGVIRWMGTLQEIQGPIAGVELDDPMEGCGDGEWRGHYYFTCPHGRGFFCPLISLRPDPRLPQPAQRGANPLNAVPDWEEQDQTIAGDQIVKYTAEGRGIQGHQNSCYLDATIFGLFALSDVFDSLFLDHMRNLTSLQSPTPTSPIQREVGTMLWKGIVNPLRKNGAVRYESVMRLRNKLEELGKMEGVNTKEKDPEEFLNMLFKHTLHVDPFITIKRPSGTEPEFFVQLFVELDKSLKVPTIEKLLMKMFKEQHISFSEVPSKLLVQVPRYGKEFQIYKRIVPGIKLDPAPLMDGQNICFICGETANNNCTDCKGDFNENEISVNFCDHCNYLVHKHPARVGHRPEREEFPELELLSVLCIETSHYVCFSRDSEGRWLFFDSMADRLYDQFNIPRGVECTAQLNEWVYEGDQEKLMAAGPRELPELVRRFTQDVYMCVYIQPDYGMYG